MALRARSTFANAAPAEIYEAYIPRNAAFQPGALRFPSFPVLLPAFPFFPQVAARRIPEQLARTSRPLWRPWPVYIYTSPRPAYSRYLGPLCRACFEFIGSAQQYGDRKFAVLSAWPALPYPRAGHLFHLAHFFCSSAPRITCFPAPEMCVFLALVSVACRDGKIKVGAPAPSRSGLANRLLRSRSCIKGPATYIRGSQ